MNDVFEINCDENDLKKIFKIGKKEDGKVKQLLIEFKNMTLKNLMMESLYKLAEASDVFKNLVISYDRTKLERTELKNLVNEAKKNRKK